jgi:hypothetical protein
MSSHPVDRQFECHVVVVSGRFGSCAKGCIQNATHSTTELSKWRFSKGISATDPLQPEVVVRTLILRDHPDLIAHAYAGNIIRFATAARIFTTRRMTV